MGNISDIIPIEGERANTWTHLVGVVMALSSVWLIWPAMDYSWQMGLGVSMFVIGMFLVFLSSTAYHWVHPGPIKQRLRKCDHISIYVMIACSYTPICIGVIGGWVGWLMFGLLWGATIVGSIIKLFAIGKSPKLSLAIYLVMGWSALFVFPTVYEKLSALSLSLVLCEGVMYTIGTYFYSHKNKNGYHAIWHIFVLLGAISHWGVVLAILLGK